MPTMKRTLDSAPTNTADLSSARGAPAGHRLFNIRHELVDAQVDVLRMYLEKRSSEHFLEALDRLIDCTCASFAEEEELMECLTGAPDPGHREMHQAVLAQLEMLRRCVLDSDRGHLLGQLILVDRQLTSHISDALQAPLLRSQARQAERDSLGAAGNDSQMHH